MSTFWIQTPSDIALSDMSGWAEIAPHKYAAVRHYLLVVPGQETGTRKGPIYKQMIWPVNAKFKIEDKITQVTKYSFGLQESITSTVTSKLSQEVVSKIGSSIKAGLAKIEGALSAELKNKIGIELVEALGSSLSTTSTYSIETSVEKGESLEIIVPANDGSSGTRPVFIYFQLRQLFWDVYLYHTDYLQLEYRKTWPWRIIRKTIIKDTAALHAPLFHIAYFQPEASFSFCFDSYVPEINDGEAIKCLPLARSCPSATLEPAATLEQLAKLAFPASRSEKKIAGMQKKQMREALAYASKSERSLAVRGRLFYRSAKATRRSLVGAARNGRKVSARKVRSRHSIRRTSKIRRKA